MMVFQFVDDVAWIGVAVIIEEGGAFFDRNAPPEHLSHIVLIGSFPGWGNREVLETGGA